MKGRTRKVAVINSIMALLGTVGIIVPVAVWSRPPGGYRVPLRPTISDPVDVPPPPKRQLTTMVRGFAELEQSRQLMLSTTQARSTLRILLRWKTQRFMFDRDAITLMETLTSPLNAGQRTQLSTYMKNNTSSGFGGGFGDMTQRQQYAFDAFRGTYNPFSDPAKHPQFKELPQEIRQRYTARWQQRSDWLKTLEKRAQEPKK
jgi:hypothetical protein